MGALVGCAEYYSHPTKSASEFEQDLYQCQKESAPVRNSADKERMEDRCLSLKGWRYDGNWLQRKVSGRP